jgi:hypothetical protein
MDHTDIVFIWKQWTVWKEQQLIEEEEYIDDENAASEGMDSIYWCWNCKYSECDYH